ncbi:MAG: glycerate kinase [Anaerolineales bacterium]
MVTKGFESPRLEQRPAVLRIVQAALQAVEPGRAVQNYFRREKELLIFDKRPYPLQNLGRIEILAAGKAAPAMSAPLALALADLAPGGLLISKQAFSPPWAGFSALTGGHPVPTEASLRAGRAALRLARGLKKDDLLICLLSGGGSALMTAPRRGVRLADLQSLTRALLACGAPIDEINSLRRRLDRVKGGGLAQAAAPAQVVSLILSDVVGNPLEAIASGPTAPDPVSRGEALEIVQKYGLLNQVSAGLLRALEKSPETPKPGAALFSRVQNILVGSNRLAAQAALRQAQDEGFRAVFLGDAWQDEARELGQTLARRLKMEAARRPVCLVAGGESTVTLRGAGRGGRNQEVALAAVDELAGLENALLLTLATDGEDGPTDAAGALVTGETQKRAAELGLTPGAFLEKNDSYSFFAALGDLLKPGPSGTNVNDLVFLFAF